MDAIEKAINKNELARHCKRKTRGAELTVQLIEELLLEMGISTDSLGTPVFNDRILTCPSGKKQSMYHAFKIPQMSLYTITGHIKKVYGVASVSVCTWYHIFRVVHLHLARL